MEMLYRLSYVGAHDRDHPSGQRGSDAERKERWTGRCGRAGAARVCVEKTHHPEGVSLAGSRLGVSRETGNLGSEAPAVNAKLGEILGLRERRGSHDEMRRSPPRRQVSMAGLKFTGRIMERETGFEPATLGLEGRCSSR